MLIHTLTSSLWARCVIMGMEFPRNLAYITISHNREVFLITVLTKKCKGFFNALGLLFITTNQKLIIEDCNCLIINFKSLIIFSCLLRYKSFCLLFLESFYLESKRYDVNEWGMRVVYSVNQQLKDLNLIDASPCITISISALSADGCIL